jgi:hypothetical protein
MKTIDGGYYMPLFACGRISYLCLQLLKEAFIDLCIHTRYYIIFLNPNVANPEHDTSPRAFNTEETALSELMIEAQDATAGRVEVARILEQVKSDQVAKNERLKDLSSVGEHLVDVRGREGAVHEKADVRIEVATADIGRHEKQIVVVDPDHLSLLLELCDGLRKLTVDLDVLLPQLRSTKIILKVI